MDLNSEEGQQQLFALMDRVNAAPEPTPNPFDKSNILDYPDRTNSRRPRGKCFYNLTTKHPCFCVRPVYIHVCFLSDF